MEDKNNIFYLKEVVNSIVREAMEDINSRLFSDNIEHCSGDMTLMSVNEVCDILSIGKTSVWKFVREGNLAIVRLNGRTLIKRSSVKALITSSSVTKGGR